MTATDANGNALTDNFRALAAGPNAFTVAALPDTHYTSIPALQHIFGDITEWLTNNAESLGIQFVIGLGDVTDNNRAAEWEIASAALHKLDGVIPYSILPGNHDQALNGSAGDHSTDFLDTLFSPEIQASINPDTFGGVYDREPDRSANTYHKFSAPDGTNWLVLSLEFAPRDDVLRWAGDVIEGHLDHRVILASHSLTNESQRQDAFGLNRPSNYTPQRYGVGNSPEGMNDGEDVYRELLSKYPNIVFTLSGHEIGEDGAHTLTSYSQHGNKFLEMLANYQRGGVHADMRPDNGQIRLLTIDPDNGSIYTSTYMTEDDEYLDGYRGSMELSRDGLTGPYRHHQETITGLDLGPVKLYAQADAGRDLFVDAPANATSATVRLDGTATLNPSLADSWEWRDENGQVIATGAEADIVLTNGKHRLTLAVTDENGRVTTDEKLVVVSGSNTLLLENFNDGDADGWQVAGASTPGIGTWQLQGTAFAPDTKPGTGEAALHDRTNDASNLLIWGDESAKDWIDYSFDVTMISTDNDHIGVVFYYQDQQNYYQFYMDDQNTSRFLVKVEDGVRNVLAVSRQGYRFNDELDLHVAVSGNEINVLLDGKSVFDGGPVVVDNPLKEGGTIGVFSSGQKSSTFDDIIVNKLSLTAHAAADARTIAEQGHDTALVNLTAASSYGPDDIVDYKWLVGDKVVATTRDAAVQLAVGTKNVTLEVTDSTGKVSKDSVNVDVISHANVLAKDDFNRSSVGDDWFILDEGTLSGPSRWEIRDGRMWEPSNIHSQQLTSGGGNQSTGDWALGWSPLGDGHFILRKGTIAVYDPADVNTRDWKDYSLSVNFRTQDNDGLGLVFYYQDPNNYYKIELDEENGHWTLSRLQDGIEQVLGQAFGGYVMGKDTDLRVDVVDHKIMVYVDGEKLFPYAIEDRELKGGTVGLYDWGSDSLSFDDVLVVSLAGTDPGEVSPYEILPNAFGGNDIFLHDADALVPELGTDNLDRVFYDGNKADVVLPGTIEQGTLLNEANDSNLFGNALDNVLTGNDFANIIKGGEGRDIMTGGKGADIFLFDAADQSGIRQIDHITDFSYSDGDKLVFDDLGVQQQANKSFLFSSVFRDGILNSSLSNMLSQMTNDAALATTAVAALMSENSVAGFKFDGDWYVVQTGERTDNFSGIRDPLSLFSKSGLKKIVDMAADHLAIDNVIEVDLVGTKPVGKLDDVVSYDLVA